MPPNRLARRQGHSSNPEAAPYSRFIVTILSFLHSWNQYTWPRAVVTESRWETIQIGLKSLSAARPEEANIGLAAAIIAAYGAHGMALHEHRRIAGWSTLTLFRRG